MCSIGGKAYRGDRDAFEDEKRYKKSSSIQVDDIEVESNSRARSSSSRTQVDAQTRRKMSLGGESEHFKDSRLISDIEDASNSQSEHATTMNGFFTVLSLCHTVLAATNNETGNIEYKAQSPDEAALVQAAADVGYVFLGKDKEILSLSTPHSTSAKKYELLDILEFTSARKRMSVVLRKLDAGNDDLLMLTKGADNVIFERLRSGEEDLKADTESHLSEFANSGLRTLTLAFRTIPGEFFWGVLFLPELTYCQLMSTNLGVNDIIKPQ